MKVNLFLIVFLLIGAFYLLSFVNYDQAAWEVPAKYEKMKNPEEATKTSIREGKKLWNKHCGSCHGKEGLGDGSKAAQLDTPAGDFSSEKFQAQSDGAIFYKTKFGRDEMPNYEKKIPYDEDLWHLVNFMRTL